MGVVWFSTYKTLCIIKHWLTYQWDFPTNAKIPHSLYGAVSFDWISKPVKGDTQLIPSDTQMILLIWWHFLDVASYISIQVMTATEIFNSWKLIQDKNQSADLCTIDFRSSTQGQNLVNLSEQWNTTRSPCLSDTKLSFYCPKRL